MSVSPVNDAMLEELIVEKKGLIIIAFMGYGSVPCDHFRPELDGLAEQLDTRAKVRWIDVHENPTITEELGVQAIPTTLIFRNGEKLAHYEGPYSREALFERIESILEPKKEKDGGDVS